MSVDKSLKLLGFRVKYVLFTASLFKSIMKNIIQFMLKYGIHTFVQFEKYSG